MVKRRGCVISRSLAGSLLAALDGDHSTVSVFNNPVYGSSSFIRRGNGKQSHQAGIQNFNNHKLRLLVWDDHAKSGHWFFSWKNGFEYTGLSPLAPDDWIESALNNASIKFSGDEIRWSKGLDEETVTNEMVIDALNEQSQKIKELKKTNKSLIKDIEHMSKMYDQLWKKIERLIKGQNPNPSI